MVRSLVGTSIRQVSAGSRHTLALSEHGEVFSWGWGQQGQLGHGQYSSLLRPTRISSFASSKIVYISAGGIHSACIDENGSCYTWGSSSYGQLGLGEKAVQLNSVCIPEIIGFTCNGDAAVFVVQISCGGMHTAAVDVDGNIWCWGRADNGQTGTANWIYSYFPGIVKPCKVKGFSRNARRVSCGAFHTMILTTDGKVFSMGREDYGMLGIGSREDSLSGGSMCPTLIERLSDKRVTDISCGGWHSILLTDSGDLYSCGKGEYGRLGVGDELSRDEPFLCECSKKMNDCSSAIGMKSVSAGGSHTIALSRDHKAYAVGRSGYGRLGVDRISVDRMSSFTEMKNPIEEVMGSKIVAVNAGGAHSAIIIEVPDEYLESIQRTYSFI